MQFEFDPNKSRQNADKHGIDFVKAQELWKDTNAIRIAARTEGEPRWIAIGIIEGKHWAAVITYRGAATRLISVRRAREGEVALYEKQKQH